MTKIEERKAQIRQAKRDAIKAAKQLGYLSRFPKTEEAIKNANNIREIDKIMCFCRKANW